MDYEKLFLFKGLVKLPFYTFKKNWNGFVSKFYTDHFVKLNKGFPSEANLSYTCSKKIFNFHIWDQSNLDFGLIILLYESPPNTFCKLLNTFLLKQNFSLKCRVLVPTAVKWAKKIWVSRNFKKFTKEWILDNCSGELRNFILFYQCCGSGPFFSGSGFENTDPDPT